MPREKSLEEGDEVAPFKGAPKGPNAEALKKFINDARSTRPYHNLAINLDWLNWAMDYLILAEKEGFTVDEEYLRIPGPSPTSPEPKVIFWDIDIGKKCED